MPKLSPNVRKHRVAKFKQSDEISRRLDTLLAQVKNEGLDLETRKEARDAHIKTQNNQDGVCQSLSLK